MEVNFNFHESLFHLPNSVGYPTGATMTAFDRKTPQYLVPGGYVSCCGEILRQNLQPSRRGYHRRHVGVLAQAQQSGQGARL